MGEHRIARLVAACLEVHTPGCLVDAFQPDGRKRGHRAKLRAFFDGDLSAIEVTPTMMYDLEELPKALCVCRLLPEHPLTHKGGKRETPIDGDCEDDIDWGVCGTWRH